MQIRKVLTTVEETRGEGRIRAEVPLRKVAVTAVFENPFANRYEADLGPLIDASAEIGREVAELARAALSPYRAASYGKGAVVGTAGEQEHGVAVLTTVFGDVLREFAGGGNAWISSVTKRGPAGTSIDVPLAHKDALYVRSHYDAMTITLPDAPLADEIAVICCYANRGRLDARVGGLRAEDIGGEDGLR